MTIGFAATRVEKDGAAFLIAADSRYSFGTSGRNLDIGIKTYSLGSRVGAVGAGSALSVNIAAEMTRSIVDDHERLTRDAPYSFYSVVRLFSFFLNKVCGENPFDDGCEVAVAGFLANGNPA